MSLFFQVLFQITLKSQITLGLPAAVLSASLISARFVSDRLDTKLQEEMLTFADSTEKSASFLKSERQAEKICLAAVQSQDEASWDRGLAKDIDRA